MEVADDGAGAVAESLGSAEGLGLRAVRQRMEARYGATASFHVTTSPGTGFAVRVALPAQASRRATPRHGQRTGHPAPVT
jgi:signal transduction histidine kinase